MAKSDTQQVVTSHSRGSAVVYLCVLAVAVLVPVSFSDWTIEASYVKLVISHALVLVAIGVWLVQVLWRGRVHLLASPLNPPLLAFWIVCLCTTLLSPYLLRSVKELWRFSMLFALAILAANHVSTRLRVQGLLTGITLAALGVSVYSFIQLLGLDPVPWGQDARDRVFSSIGSPSMLAGYMDILIPLTIGLAFSARAFSLKLLASITCACCVLTLYRTQTKGGWLAAGVGVTTLFLYAWRAGALRRLEWTRWRRVIAGLVLFIVLAACAVMAKPAVRRFITTFRDSAGVRIVCWRGAWGIFKEHPVLGAGLGTFQIFFPKHRDPDFRAKSLTYNTLHAHSEYLQILAEEGAIGLAVFLWLLVTLFREAWRGACSPAAVPADQWNLSGLIGGSAGVLAHNIVTVDLRWVDSPTTFWIVVGAILAISNLASNGAMCREIPFDWPLRRRVELGIAGLGLLMVLGIVFIVDPFQAQIHLRRADRLMNGKAWDAAIRELNRGIEKDPCELRFYYKLGEAHFGKKEYQLSLEAYRRLQLYAPDYAQVHYNIGLLYVALGRWDEAIPAFTQASRMGLIPPDLPLPQILTKIDPTGQSPMRMTELLKSLVNANPKDKAAWYRLAMWHYHQKQLEEAIRAFERVLELDNRHVDALNDLAGVYFAQRKLDKTVELCRRVLEIDPAAHTTRVNLGRAYYVMGDKAAAAEEWRKVLAVAPNHPEAKRCLQEWAGETTPSATSPAKKQNP